MNKTKIILISLGALFFSRPAGYCTANGVADDLASLKAEFDKSQAALQQQITDLQSQNAALQKQLIEATAAPSAPPEDTGVLGLLCKGAGVDLKDVRWRVQAGLDPEQAVQAALAQKATEARRAEKAAAAQTQEAK